MLNRNAFLREMGLLAERFNRTISELVIARYYDTLKDRLTPEEFEQAARFVFDQDSFWPAPARFIELAQGNTKDDAEREWRALLDACARGDRNLLLSPEGAAAMRAVGGWNAIAYCESPHHLEAKHRSFVQHHVGAREERELLRLLPAARTALELDA